MNTDLLLHREQKRVVIGNKYYILIPDETRITYDNKDYTYKGLDPETGMLVIEELIRVQSDMLPATNFIIPEQVQVIHSKPFDVDDLRETPLQPRITSDNISNIRKTVMDNKFANSKSKNNVLDKDISEDLTARIIKMTNVIKKSSPELIKESTDSLPFLMTAFLENNDNALIPYIVIGLINLTPND